MATDLTELAGRIHALPIEEKLELAAALIRNGKLELAAEVVERAGSELAVLVMMRGPKRG
jgi:hypothetical protein